MCSGTTKSLKDYSIILALVMILPACAAPMSNLDPLGETGTVPAQSPAENEPTEVTELVSTTPDQHSPQVQESRLQSLRTTAITPGGQTDPREGGTTPSVVSPPPQNVISKIFPNELPAPSGEISLNTPTLRWQASTQTAQVGDQFILSIETQQVRDLFSAPFYLQYDPGLLEFIGLTEGEFLKKDGNPTVFIYSVDADMGKIVVGLSRLGGGGGITGSGVLAQATFKAKTPGIASVAFQNVDFRDIRLEPVNVTLDEGGEIQVR